MADAPKIGIPENHQEFCKEVARLCRKHGLTKFSGSYRPHWKDQWDGDIQFSWEQGRHGEDSDRLFIQSQILAHTRLGPEPERFA